MTYRTLRTIRHLTYKSALQLPFATTDAVLRDLEDGRGAELEIRGAVSPIAADAELIEIGVGPVQLQGSIGEWRKVLDRELDDLFDLAELPAPSPGVEWEGLRQPLSVLDSE